MTFTFNHYEKGNLSIPSAALKVAGLNGETKLEGHIGAGQFAVTKKQMTAKELIVAIEFFKDLATDLTVKLALACGECDDCGYCCGEEFWDDENSCPDDCTHCKTPCHGVEIPTCLLEDAGIDPEVGLQFDTRDGEIVIREIEQAEPAPNFASNFFDNGELDAATQNLHIAEMMTRFASGGSPVPAGLLEVLAQSDICLQSLRELLESGEVVYG